VGDTNAQPKGAACEVLQWQYYSYNCGILLYYTSYVMALHI